MNKFLLRPENTSYSAKVQNESLSVQLEGGAGKYRKDIIDASFFVDVDYKLSARQFEYAQAFRRTATENGSLPFTTDLIIDTPDLVEYTARFKTPFTIGQRGATYFISCTLEVEAITGMSGENPAGVSKASDEDIIEAFEADPNL